MSVQYDYEESLFPNGVSLDDLTREVNDLLTGLLYINYYNGVVSFFFSEPIDTTVLDNIVATSVITIPIGTYNISFSINDEDYTDTTYTVVNTIQGADYLNNMTNIIAVSNIKSGTGTYTLRLYNVSTRETIASKTFSNFDQIGNDLGTISNRNITSSSILELHCKINGSCRVNVSNLALYYNV